MRWRNNAAIVLLVASTATSGLLMAAEDDLQQALLADPDAVAAGESLFNQNCVYCHGHRGVGGKARTLQGRSNLRPNYLFETISNGKRRGSLVMPPWKRSLDERQRWQLVAYIRSLSEDEP